MTRQAQWSSVNLNPAGRAAAMALQDATGLSKNDLYNLALVALARQWSVMPDYKLATKGHTVKDGPGRKRVDWTF